MKVLLLFAACCFCLLANAAYAGVEKPVTAIVIDLTNQVVEAYEGQTMIRSMECMSGDPFLALDPRTGKLMRGEKPTPQGTFSIIGKDKYHRSADYDADMPYAMRFFGRCWIHAWSWEELNLPDRSIRRNHSSHGCVSLNLADAKWLFEHTPIGAKVYVIGERTND